MAAAMGREGGALPVNGQGGVLDPQSTVGLGLISAENLQGAIAACHLKFHTGRKGRI